MGPARPTFVYLLFDPTGESKRHYVGKTWNKPSYRRRRHIKCAQGGDRKFVYQWIRKLLSRGVEPEMRILETVPAGEDWAASEAKWIAHYRNCGDGVTNATDGGEGVVGYRLPDDNRRKWSAERRSRSLRSDNKTGFRGVTRFRGRFAVRIHLPDGYHSVGVFDTAEEAGVAYDAIARQQWGEVAALNFPFPGERSARPGIEPREWDLPKVEVRPAGLRRTNATGHKGVYWNSQHRKWQAQVYVAGRRRTVGSFDTAEEAGEFARRCESDPEFAREWMSRDKRADNGTKVQRVNRTGFRGVKRERFGNYVARFHHGDGDIHLGTYATPEEAAVAYDDKAREVYGAAALLNFPEPGERSGRTGIEPRIWGTERPSPRPLIVANRSPETRSKTAAAIQSLPTNNSTGFKGVTLLNKGRCLVQKYGSYIREGGKGRFLGSFSTPEDAARAYDVAARTAWGAAAALNFPGPGEKSARKPK